MIGDGRRRRAISARADRTGPAASQAAERADEIAASLQRTCRGWLIMWSAWRGTFTAFSAITPDPMVIDETSVHRLLARISEIEQAVTRDRASSTSVDLRPYRMVPAGFSATL